MRDTRERVRAYKWGNMKDEHVTIRSRQWAISQEPLFQVVKEKKGKLTTSLVYIGFPELLNPLGSVQYSITKNEMQHWAIIPYCCIRSLFICHFCVFGPCFDHSIDDYKLQPDVLQWDAV